MRRKNQKDLSQTTLSGSVWNLCLHRTGKSGNIRTRIYRNDPERSASQAVSFVAMGVLLQIGGKCSSFRAKPSHFSGHLPCRKLCSNFSGNLPECSTESNPCLAFFP